MNLKDIQIRETLNTHNSPRAYLQSSSNIRILAEDIDALDLYGRYFEGYKDPANPLQGLQSEDGERTLDSYIRGTERLRTYLDWMIGLHGEECAPSLLEEWWPAYEAYEKTHLMALYSKPVTKATRPLYATWAQAEEYTRTLFPDDEEWEEAKKDWRERQFPYRNQPLG